MAENILNRFENIYDEEPELDLTKKVKVGIIGTGWIAEEHIRGYKEMPDVEIVAAADLVPGKAEKFCKNNGLEASVATRAVTQCWRLRSWMQSASAPTTASTLPAPSMPWSTVSMSCWRSPLL